MSQLPIRDKLKIIGEAVKQEDSIKERPKRIGLTIFFIVAIIGLSGVVILAVLLAMNNYLKTAFLIMVFAVFSFYIVYKLITADDLHSL